MRLVRQRHLPRCAPCCLEGHEVLRCLCVSVFECVCIQVFECVCDGFNCTVYLFRESTAVFVYQCEVNLRLCLCNKCALQHGRLASHMSMYPHVRV